MEHLPPVPPAVDLDDLFIDGSWADDNAAHDPYIDMPPLPTTDPYAEIERLTVANRALIAENERLTMAYSELMLQQAYSPAPPCPPTVPHEKRALALANTCKLEQLMEPYDEGHLTPDKALKYVFKSNIKRRFADVAATRQYLDRVL